MIDPANLVRDVKFAHDFDPAQLEWNSHYACMQAGPVSEDGLTQIVGFAAPYTAQGELDTAVMVEPVTSFDELAAELRTIDAQGKGVGPRVYNMREAIAGFRQRPEWVGLYLFNMMQSDILDLRPTQGTSLQRIGRHAGRLVRAKLESPRSVVQTVHNSYGAAHAVLLEVPPAPLRRQKQRGVSGPEGLTPQFFIIRNSSHRLHKIGETTSPW